MRRLITLLKLAFYKLRIWSLAKPHRALVAFLGLALLASTAIALIWTPNNKVVAPSIPPPKTSSETLTDKAAMYKVTLPEGWVEQKDITAEVAGEELVALAPQKRIDAFKDQTGKSELLHTSIVLYHTTDSPQDWFNKQHFNTPVLSKDLPLPDKSAFGAKIVTESYSEDHYVVSHNGVLLHLTFHRISHYFKPDRTDDFSTDLGDFDKLFTSITFLE